MDDLYHVDYARYLWTKPTNYNIELKYKKTGFVYGPIRLSATEQPVNRLLIKPTSSTEFIKDKKAIFLIRDPRDILVSQYYSFGFTHNLNHTDQKRKAQLKLREKIQSLSIDQYVLANANQQIHNFDNLSRIAKDCKKSIIVKYEDMIENYNFFISQIKTIGNLSDDVVQIIYTKSRPKIDVDNSSHRRSGEIRRFMKDLQPETVIKLTKKLEKTLQQFQFKS
jgi:hypothetical protein